MRIKRKGSSIIEFIVIVIVLAAIAAAIIPPIQTALDNKQAESLNYYKGNDTSIN